MTDPIVVDTNVLAISEGQHANASEACLAACVRLARRIQEGDVALVVDEGDAILNEYLGRLSGGGTASVGVKIVRRLRQRKHDETICRRVPITPIDDPPGSYQEVPESLRDFDTDDQKFLAVAKAEASSPQIYAGLDEEWWCRRKDLSEAGYDIQFLCSDDLMDVEC